MDTLKSILKYTAIIVVAIALVIIFFQLKECGKHPDIIDRDTTIVHDSIFIKQDSLVIKYISTRDTVYQSEDGNWYSVAADTVLSNKDTVSMIYTSPVKLSPKGFFDLAIKYSPKWINADTVVIRETITKYEMYLPWTLVFLITAVSFITGVLI